MDATSCTDTGTAGRKGTCLGLFGIGCAQHSNGGSLLVAHGWWTLIAWHLVLISSIKIALAREPAIAEKLGSEDG